MQTVDDVEMFLLVPTATTTSHLGRARTAARRARRGTAVVESAVTLPILFLMVFGAIEISNAIFLRQSLAIATYEGARTGTRPGATQAHAVARVNEILSARGIENYTVQVLPNLTNSTPRGTTVTVTVRTTAPADGFGPVRLFSNKQLSQTTNMVRL